MRLKPSSLKPPSTPYGRFWPYLKTLAYAKKGCQVQTHQLILITKSVTKKKVLQQKPRFFSSSLTYQAKKL
jgi:hypothetical protein